MTSFYQIRADENSGHRWFAMADARGRGRREPIARGRMEVVFFLITDGGLFFWEWGWWRDEMEEREKGKLLMCKVGQVSIFDWDTGCSVGTVLGVSFLLVNTSTSTSNNNYPFCLHSQQHKSQTSSLILLSPINTLLFSFFL